MCRGTIYNSNKQRTRIGEDFLVLFDPHFTMVSLFLFWIVFRRSKSIQYAYFYRVRDWTTIELNRAWLFRMYLTVHLQETYVNWYKIQSRLLKKFVSYRCFFIWAYSSFNYLFCQHKILKLYLTPLFQQSRFFIISKDWNNFFILLSNTEKSPKSRYNFSIEKEKLIKIKTLLGVYFSFALFKIRTSLNSSKLVKI